MTESLHEEIFVEQKQSAGPKLLAAIAALIITVLLFAGYAYLRQRHEQKNRLLASSSQASRPEPKGSPQALILVNDALLQGGKTILGGTVKNISPQKLGDVSVELELKRRKDAMVDKVLVPLEPSQLEPDQEGHYSLELKTQEYGSARVAALRVSPNSSSLPYTVAQGQKRPPERLESKTITIGKRPSKAGDFLNSPDNPARIP
jgi:hypothetical protein